jgi:hypothetical protein
MRLAALLIPVAFAAPVSHAGESWVKDPSDFPSSPLCKPREVTLWTCTARRRIYSLCAQKGALSERLAIQYRVRDQHGRTVFRYPEPMRGASAAFAYEVSANGDAEVDFTIGKTTYSLVDPLRDVSFLSIVRDGKERSHRTCDEGNQSLQLNDTMALMKALKVPPPN